MADINLSIAFSSDQQSIRQIQREINRALRDVSTQIDVNVNPNFFRNLTDTIQNLNIEISDLAVNQSAVEAIRDQINRGIDVEITEIDVNQRALDSIQRRIEEVTTAIGIQGQVERGFERGATAGSLGGALRPQVQSAAQQAGLSLERDIIVQLEQRDTLEKTLVQLTQGQVLLQRQINQKLNEGSNKFQDAQIKAVQALEDIGDDLLAGRIDPSAAIKAIDKLSQSSALTERTFREATPQTRRFLLEVEELAGVTRQIAETIGLQESTQRRVAREGERQATFNREISDLEQQVIDGRIKERDAIRAAVRLAGRVSENPLGGAETDITARQREANLSRLNALRIGAENALEAARNEAELAKQVEEGEKQATSIRARQQRILDRNIQIIERINNIREDILNGDIRERDARRQLRSIERQGVQTGGLVDPNVAREQEQAQRAALQAAQDAIPIAREAVAKQAAAQELIDATNAERTREFGFLKEANDIERELNAKRLGTNQAITRINRILSQIEDPGVEIFDNELVGALRGELQNQLSKLRELVTTIDQAAENEKQALNDRQRAERASERAVQAERSAIENAVEIRDALNQGLIDAQQASREVTRLLRRSSQGGNILDADVAQDLNDTLQIELRITQEAVRNKRRQQEATQDAADTQKRIDAANRENLNAAKRLNQIFLDQVGGRISADEARRRIANLEINVLGDLAGALEQRLRTESNRLDTVSQAEQLERANIEALEREIAFRRRISKNLLEQADISQKQIAQANRVSRQIQNELVESQRTGVRQFTQPQRQVAPSDVLFRNAGDVQNFVQSLNPQQLERFTQTLDRTSRRTNDAQRSVDRFGNSLDEAASSSSRINRNVQRGANLAQEFGRQVGQASSRLLAWAAPANLIFLTVSRLRGAVNEIINLDREARRLIFFRNAGAIVTQSATAFGNSSDAVRELGEALQSNQININGITAATEKLVATNEDLTNEFTLTASIARDYGLSISAVQDALVTVSRVGQQAVDATGRTASVFTDAALSLVRLERGALGATEAVRGLTAIQAQFFGGIRGNVFTAFADEATRAATAAQLTSNAAALLAVTSAGSSANVSELTDAATRLGSAFVNLQGLNFPQTIAILGEAFTATGASTGRLATALRQSATLIKQNAAEIRELTGGSVDVIDAQGGVRGFEAILEVLRRIKDEAGSLEAVDLSLLIADRRNVADVAALAQNVDRLSDAYKRFQDPIQRANRILAAQQFRIKQNESLAQSLEGRINSLGTAFKELVQGQALRSFLSSAIGGFTSIIDGASTLINVIGSLVSRFGSAGITIAAAIGSFAIGNIASAARDVVRGFKLAFSESAKLEESVRRTQRALSIEQSTLAAIQDLQTQGVINAERQLQLETTINAIRLQVAEKLALQLALNQAIVNEEAKETIDLEVINDLERQRVIVNEEIVALKQQERREIRQIIQDTEKLAAEEAALSRTGGSRNRNLSAAGIVIGTAVQVALRNVEGDFAKSISNGISGGIAGGIAGAQLGGKAGPIGAIIGFVIGAFQDEIAKLISDIGDQIKRAAGAAVLGPELEENLSTQSQITQTIIQIQAAQKAVTEQLKDASETSRERLESELRYLDTLEQQALAQQQLLLNGARLSEQAEELEKRSTQTGIRAGIPIFGIGQAQEATQAGFQAEFARKEAEAINKTTKETANALRVQSAERIASAQAATDLDNATKTEQQRRQSITRILQENIKLTRVLLDEESSYIDRVRARERRNKNILELQKEQNANLPETREAAQAVTLELERQEEAINRISRQQGTIGAIFETLASFEATDEIRLGIDTQQFNAQITELRRQIEEREAGLEDIGAFSEDAGKELIAENKKAAEEIANLQTKRFQALFNRQREITRESLRSVTQQISAFETAGKTLTDSFKSVVSEQERLADTFKNISDVSIDIINRSSEAIGEFLENTGASVAQRLENVADASRKQLDAARTLATRQLSTVGDTFFDGRQLNEDFSNLINSLATASALAEQEIVDEKSFAVKEEIALVRERVRVEREDFQRRISETRREISIRRDLINREIEILNTRLDAEKELNQLRLEQLQEFGDALLESPKKFQEELENIDLAKRFFRGIENLNEESLRTIRGRSQQLRRTGRQDVLNRVVEGLESAIRFGQSDIVGGVGNERLRQAFSASQSDQIERLDIVADLFRRQTAIANEQSNVQKAIRERQQLLVNLAELDIELQRALVGLAQADTVIAREQRARQLDELRKISSKLTDNRTELANIITGIREVFTTGLTSRGLNRLSAGGEISKAIAPIVDSFRRQFDIFGSEAFFSPFTKVGGVFRQLEDNLREQIQQDTAQAGSESKNLSNAQAEQARVVKEANERIKELTAEIEKQRAVLSGLEKPGEAGGIAGDRQTVSQLINGIQSQITTNGSGRFFGFESRRLQELANIESEGGQLTREERVERARLQRLTSGRFTADERGNRQLLRTLGRDSEQFNSFVSAFRGTLRDTEADDEFIDRARRLRGEGARGRRNIDVGATQDLLRRFGFEGAASRATTRGGAARELDRLISLSEALAEEQGKISRDTQKKIISILSSELTPGIKRVVGEASDAVAGQVVGGFSDQLLIASNKLSEAAALKATNEVRAAAVEQTKAAVEKIVADQEEAANNFRRALEEGAANVKQTISEAIVKVEPVEIRTEVAVRTPDSLGASELSQLLVQALTPIFGNTQLAQVNAQNLAALIAELSRRQIIQAQLPSDLPGLTPPDTGGVVQRPPFRP